ncbi:MAG: hypothetical protein Q8M26_13455 [Pseudolabrys sp.]|nr:hypothetical protein [Pseudolabrys sp.]
MDERKDTEETKSDPQVAPVAKAAPDLPSVQSPSISPAAAETVPEPVIEPVIEPVTATAPEIAVEPVAPADAAAAAAPSRFILRPRHKRYALLAASVTMAAAIGAVVGAVASGGFASPPPAPAAPRVDVAAIEDTKAMQQQVARLAREVTTLKANLDAANKASRTQIAKISEKLTDRVSRESAEVTGSISAPETTAPAPQAMPAPVQAAVPTPTPRPQQLAALETRMPGRAPLVAGWSIHDFRNGHLYVEGNGEIYQVVPGARLPGIGAVESIKRQEGRWVVLTPKGIIVAARDRRYFDPF